MIAVCRLDQNRAAAQLAVKAGVEVAAVSRVTIWGNHSATQVRLYNLIILVGVPSTLRVVYFNFTMLWQVPDAEQAMIAGRKAADLITDKVCPCSVFSQLL